MNSNQPDIIPWCSWKMRRCWRASRAKRSMLPHFLLKLFCQLSNYILINKLIVSISLTLEKKNCFQCNSWHRGSYVYNWNNEKQVQWCDAVNPASQVHAAEERRRFYFSGFPHFYVFGFVRTLGVERLCLTNRYESWHETDKKLYENNAWCRCRQFTYIFTFQQHQPVVWLAFFIIVCIEGFPAMNSIESHVNQVVISVNL